MSNPISAQAASIFEAYDKFKIEFIRTKNDMRFEDESDIYTLTDAFGREMLASFQEPGYEIPKSALKKDHTKASPSIEGIWDVIDRRFVRNLLSHESDLITKSEIEDFTEALASDLTFHVLDNQKNHTSYMYDLYDYIDDEIDLTSKEDSEKLMLWIEERMKTYQSLKA